MCSWKGDLHNPLQWIDTLSTHPTASKHTHKLGPSPLYLSCNLYCMLNLYSNLRPKLYFAPCCSFLPQSKHIQIRWTRNSKHGCPRVQTTPLLNEVNVVQCRLVGLCWRMLGEGRTLAWSSAWTLHRHSLAGSVSVWPSPCASAISVCVHYCPYLHPFGSIVQA